MADPITPAAPAPAATPPTGTGLPWSGNAEFNQGVRAGLAFALSLIRHPKFTPPLAADAVNAAVSLADASLAPRGDDSLRESVRSSRENFLTDVLFLATEVGKQQWDSTDPLQAEFEAILKEGPSGPRNGTPS